MVRVLAGPNSFGLRQALKSLKTDFVKQYGALALEIIDGEEADFGQILSAVESVPFLASKKLIIVYNLSLIKDISEMIEKLIAAAQDNKLVIVEPKVDKRGTYYKYLKKNTEFEEFNELDERELASWLVTQAKDAGAQLSPADANFLVQRIGSTQELAASELDKLINYDKQITRANIELLVEASPQATAFNLLDAAFAGNGKRALSIYEEQRTQGEEPLKIFGLIIWQMHLIAMVDAARNRSDAEVMNISGLKPFTLNKTRSIARRMGREQIKIMLNKLVELDRQIKTTSVDADDALKNLLMSIS